MAQAGTYFVVSNPVPVGSLPLNVLFTGQSQTRPSHKVGPKVYDYYLMHHVCAGTGVFTQGQSSTELRAGHTFLIAPEQLVSYEASAEHPWHYRWVAFNGEAAASLVAAAGLMPVHPIIDTGRSRRIVALLGAIERIFRRGTRQAPLQAAGYLQLLLSCLAEAAEPPASTRTAATGDAERLVQQVIHYLSTQYAQPVSVEQMADSLGYSRAYLSRLFKQHTGTTPVSFLLRFRLDKARQLLRERHELTTSQIAASAGFQDALYFSKQFHHAYGMSPSAYRLSMRQLAAPSAVRSPEQSEASSRQLSDKSSGQP